MVTRGVCAMWEGKLCEIKLWLLSLSAESIYFVVKVYIFKFKNKKSSLNCVFLLAITGIPNWFTERTDEKRLRSASKLND